jgi:hypothetical protein
MWSQRSQKIITLTAMLLSGPMALDCAAADNFKLLNEREIHSRIIGKIVEEEVDRHWSFHFLQGGSLETRDMAKKGNGRWIIQGKQLCFGQTDEQMQCYGVWLSRTHVRLRTVGGVDLHGTIEKYKGIW